MITIHPIPLPSKPPISTGSSANVAEINTQIEKHIDTFEKEIFHNEPIETLVGSEVLPIKEADNSLDNVTIENLTKFILQKINNTSEIPQELLEILAILHKPDYNTNFNNDFSI